MKALDDELFEAFLGEIAVDANSKRNYRYSLEMYQAFLDEKGVYFDEVTPGEVELFARVLWREHRNSVAQGVFSMVRRLHEWASLNGIAPDVARSVRPRKAATPYCRLGISTGQAREILLTAGSGRNGALANVLVRTAVKTGGITGMRVRDVIITPEGSEIRLRSRAWVPITSECSAVLSEYLKDMGKAAECPEEALFPSRSSRSWGEPLSQRSIRGIMQGICDAAGLPESAGEYHLGSAALDLAIEEGEPLDVVLSISDRTWPHRMRAEMRKPGGKLWL